LKQNKRVPRISTRGFYDLASGSRLKNKSYYLYPKKFFEKLGEYPEFTIMVHGLRNNKSGALAKSLMAQKRLKQLGYKYPVVGFSYDSNTKGVQYKSTVIRATKVGQIIAKKNGKNLACFIVDFKNRFPHIKITLIGHSLGTEVILYALSHLAKKQKAIERVIFFGSSIPSSLVDTKESSTIFKKTIKQELSNYYSTNDEVLKYAHSRGIIKNPIGYHGTGGKALSKFIHKRVMPANHRFASYVVTMKSL